ncbi:MAG: NIPSNAP family protein [Bacteroidota bacterium]|nr:NIPSNAP family containing protein [Odoribacter sp.]MDP3641732.1 NIPSNAP family protein [Bacteroidota bacterium]
MNQTKNYSPKFILIVLLALVLSFTTSAASIDYYQIQVFRLNGKAQETKVDNFLKNAYLPALHRAGIKTVGVFKPIESDTTSGKRVYVWIPFKSLNHFSKIQDDLANDQEYQSKGSDFLGAPYNQVPFLRKESILLKAFSDAPEFFIPNHKTSPAERIYELRSYEGPTENLFRQKVKMFNEGGEIKLFKKLDFNAVFYAEVVSGSTMPNLMYLTTFADMAANTAHWDAFRNHPDWKALSALEEYKNTVSKSVKILLHPTDYSDF